MKLKFTQSLSLAVLIATMLVGCTNSPKTIKDKFDNSFNTGEVYEQVNGIENDIVDYALYLPKGYNGKDNLPVIFFIDAHAYGAEAISRYTSLADKYGYIFIGSNKIKGGLTGKESQNLFSKLMEDAESRFAIDKERMFTAGFSGGAKLAAIFAGSFNRIIGTIACGGSIPSAVNFEPTYYYAGIVGNKDFNYLEVMRSFNAFDEKGFDYVAEIFDGAHVWPPVESFEKGLIGMELYSMKMKRKPIDEKWLDELFLSMENEAKELASNNEYINVYEQLQQMSRWFYGLKNVTSIRQEIVLLKGDRNFIQALNERRAIVGREVKYRAEYIKALQLRDIQWWTGEVDQLRESGESGNSEISNLTSRMLNYLSMASYMLVKADLEEENLDGAAKKLEIYKLIDPKNYDVYLFEACYQLKMGDKTAMIDSYKKAMELGFDKPEQYRKELIWAALFAQEEIQSLIG